MDTRIRRSVLRQLLRKDTDVWHILKAQDASIPELYKELHDMLAQGLIKNSKDLLSITPRGIEEACKLKISKVMPVKIIKHNKIRIPKVWQEIKKEFEEIAKARPEASIELDQGWVETNSLMMRLALLQDLGDLDGRRLILIGDDDLFGILAALTRLTEQVTVLEIDERLVKFIEDVIHYKALDNLTVYRYDVREPLPEQLIGSFNVFLTDPVETIPGTSIFISRGAQALSGPRSAGYLALTRVESSLKKWHSIEKDILEMGFVITDIIRDFNEYWLDPDELMTTGYEVITKSPVATPKPQINWYFSHLVRIEAVDTPKPLFTGKVDIGYELYYDDETYVTKPAE